MELYSRCRDVREGHKEELGVEAEWMLPELLGTSVGGRPQKTAVLWAVGAYATYPTTNGARHAGGFTAEAARAAFRQAVTDAAAEAQKVSQLPREHQAGYRRAKRRMMTISKAFAAI